MVVLLYFTLHRGEILIRFVCLDVYGWVCTNKQGEPISFSRKLVIAKISTFKVAFIGLDKALPVIKYMNVGD